MEELQKVKDYIILNYKPEDGAITSLWSDGNSDDVFDDGIKFGTCQAMFSMGKILGLNLKEPELPDFD